jgi:BirA family biotin operon repressor/biotin-[acetyl-CoA-carboxylase] ligase
MMPMPEPLCEWEGRSLEDWRDAWGIPAFHAFARIPSTNDVGRALAEAGAPSLTTILAEEQTAGRGRFGRSWTAPAANALLVSLLLRPSPGAPSAPTAPLRVGIAVAAALERLGVRSGLKWPNDVVAIDGRKLAGILCEGAVSSTDGRACVVAGIGINVNQEAGDWTPELRPQATSIRIITGRPFARAVILEAVLDAMRPHAERVGHPLSADEEEQFRRYDRLAGRSVRIDGVPAGVANGITADGALRIATPDAERLVWSGTVRIDRGAVVHGPMSEEAS